MFTVRNVFNIILINQTDTTNKSVLQRNPFPFVITFV